MTSYADRVRTRLLRPSWLVLHLLVGLALYAMVRLGIWQWGRGEARGSIRNYSYGLEWWAFVALTLVGWVKFCRDETAPAPRGTGRRRGQMSLHPRCPSPQPVSAQEDPELAAWNDRFADLARRDAERRP